jgi:hypothetical protein
MIIAASWLSVRRSSLAAIREVSLALNELAAVIAKLSFIESELQLAKQDELKRQREKPTELGPNEPKD